MDDIVYVPFEGDSDESLSEQMRKTVLDRLTAVGKKHFTTNDIPLPFLKNLGNGMHSYTPEEAAEYSKSKFGDCFTIEILCCTDKTNQLYCSTVNADLVFCFMHHIKVIIVYENDYSNIFVQSCDVKQKYSSGIKGIIV
jgi:hypothetical protein